MKTRKKLSIAITSLVVVVCFAILSVSAILAARNIITSSVINVTYTVDKVAGNAKASYKVGENGDWTNMIDANNGNATTLHYNNTENFTSSLAPASTIELTEDDSFVTFKYEFNNIAESTYYASVNYADDQNNTDKNIKIEYSRDGSYFTSNPEMMELLGVEDEEVATEFKAYYIKVSVISDLRSAEFSGTFNWNLVGASTYRSYLNIVGTKVTGLSETGAAITNLNLAIPYGITEISGLFGDTDVRAFQYNTNIKNLYISGSVETIGHNAFDLGTETTAHIDSIVIGDGVETIGEHAFVNTKCTSIVIPASVSSIDVEAFLNNTYLTEAHFEDSSIATLSDGMFKNCTSLVKVVLPSSVTTMHFSSFKNANALRVIEIADKFTMEFTNGFDGIFAGGTGSVKLAEGVAPTDLATIMVSVDANNNDEIDDGEIMNLVQFILGVNAEVSGALSVYTYGSDMPLDLTPFMG